MSSLFTGKLVFSILIGSESLFLIFLLKDSSNYSIRELDYLFDIVVDIFDKKFNLIYFYNII